MALDRIDGATDYHDLTPKTIRIELPSSAKATTNVRVDRSR